MKKIALFSFLLIPLFAICQEEEDSKLTYEEVINVENASKDELYNRAKIWFVNSFNSSNDVIQMDNKEDGQIIGKAIFIYKPSMLQQSEQSKGPVKYTFSVFLKEGRYKYEVTNFIHEPNGNSYGTLSVGLITPSEKFPDTNAKQQGLRNKIWIDLKQQIQQNIEPLISSLKKQMSIPSETKKKDW